MTKPTCQEWKDLADWYEDTPDQSGNPYTQEAYRELCETLENLFSEYCDEGIEFILYSGDHQPYLTSSEMFMDIAFNKLYVFMGGSMLDRHALSRPSNVYGFTYNHLFRAVHDMDHFHRQAGFDAQGELQTFRFAYKHYPHDATFALAAESIAQTAWVNFGRHLRNPDGTLPKKGDANYVPLYKRPYAEQKMLVVPEQLLKPFLP